MRHGDADAEIPEGLGDDARPLTTKARHAIFQHFEQLTDRMKGAGLVLTSPLVRAVQTAQILAIAQRQECPVRVVRGLLPDMPVGALEPLFEAQHDQAMILVGHQPSMGALAAHLLGMQSFPRSVSPGTVIAIESSRPKVSDGSEPPSPPGAAKLLFYAQPGQPLLDSVEF